MKPTEGLPWLGPLVVGAGLTFGSAVALLATWSLLGPSRELAAVPRASLAAPVAGPAIYRGELYANERRATPRGHHGALFWWWVGKTGKNRRTGCTALVSGGLVLRDSINQARVEMFDDRLGVSLLADGRDEWNEKRVIDLGSAPPFDGDVPAGSPCNGMSYRYQERVVEEGAEVEILGCYSDGELRPCPGAIGGVLGVPTVSVHLWRRAQRAHLPVRVVAVAGLVGLIALSVLGGRMRARRHAVEQRPEARL